MTAAEFVWKIIHEQVSKTSWKAVAEKAGVSENTLRGVERGKAKFQTLIQIIGKLVGPDAGDDFVIRFGKQIPGFSTQVMRAEHCKESRIMPLPMDAEHVELRFLTGSDHGATLDELTSEIPHRVDYLKKLIAEEKISVSNGRYYSSDYSIGGKKAIEHLSVMLDALKYRGLEHRRGQSAYDIERFTEEGFEKLVDACKKFDELVSEIKQNHSSADGIPTLVGSLVITTLNNESTANRIDSYKGERG